MVYDAQHALEHPEVAGWALGSLDPDDVAVFEQHVQTCEQCRGEVAEFTPVAESLALAAPAVEPPADLEFKVVAAAAVTAAALLGASLFESAPALAATFTLRPQPGQVGSATAVARSVTGGFQIKIDLKHLAKLGPGQFYECVYVGQRGGELVSGGTFLTSNGTVTMQSAANPSEFRIIQIRREQPGVDVQHAPVVLTGVADTHS